MSPSVPTTHPLLPYGEQEALLVLEDGTVARGRAYGARGRTLGELVFTTGMTGYQETLTDAARAGQIVLMTAPHVGNVGLNGEDPQAKRIWARGLVVRDPARRASSWRADTELADELQAQDVVGIAEVDTRALTRHLRVHGAMRAGIFSGPHLPAVPGRQGLADLVEQVRAVAPTAAMDLSQVTTPAAHTIEPDGRFDPPVGTVAVVDLGSARMTARHLTVRGVRVRVLPAGTGAEDLLDAKPAGVLFTDGPGDPAAADQAVEVLRAVLTARVPFFGVGLGHQLLGRALGLATYKLKVGHHGLNHPVRDLRTGRVHITAHGHGFAVAEPGGQGATGTRGDGRFGGVRVSHVSLTDGVVEGLECADVPAFSVQFHPAAAAGPRDAADLFDRFVAMIATDAVAPAAGEEV